MANRCCYACEYVTPARAKIGLLATGRVVQRKEQLRNAAGPGLRLPTILGSASHLQRGGKRLTDTGVQSHWARVSQGHRWGSEKTPFLGGTAAGKDMGKEEIQI